MSGEKKPPIIKKVIKKGHGGHHGGSWKVAYADFVTAMMAFFLVMWLLAISSEQGKAALADYFNELTMYDAVFNGGLPSAFTEGGTQKPSVLEGGCFSPKSDGDATVDTEANSEAAQAQMAALVKTTQELLENLDSLPAGVDGGEGSGDAGRTDAEGGPLTPDQQQFADGLTSEIQGSLGDAAAGQVLVEKVKGGLRIQIVDKDGRPMFQSGGPGLTQQARAILDVVAARLAPIPNKISIEGHTDALTFSGQRFTNWELSTARASAARVYLASKGLSEDRITSVTGYAATQPLDKSNPSDPINRRIRILIWDEEPSPPAAPPAPAPAPAPPAGTHPAPPSGGTAPTTPAEATPAPPSGPSSVSPPPAGNGAAPSNGAAVRPQGNGPVAPPPLPRPPTQRPASSRPGSPALSPEELETQLIESTMEKAASPDLSTVGPAQSPTPSTE